MTGARPRIAFIGLGQMGSRMATRLAEAGLPIAVHDIDGRAMEPFGATPRQGRQWRAATCS